MTHGVGFVTKEERAGRTNRARGCEPDWEEAGIYPFATAARHRQLIAPAVSGSSHRKAHRKADTRCHARSRNATRPLNELPDGVGRRSRASGFGRRASPSTGRRFSSAPAPWTPWPKRAIEEARAVVCQLSPAVAWRRATTRHLLREA